MYADAHVYDMEETRHEARGGRDCKGRIDEVVSEPVKPKPHYWGITVH